MLNQIDAPAAAAAGWDAIVAGSSFSAMFFLMGLPAHWRVLIVEKGEVIPHDRQLDERSLPLEDFAMANGSGRPKRWVSHRAFGGNSNCWWGQVPRFHPSDFRLHELHGHGAPWPFGYDEIEPFYAEVEAAMEISGGGNEHILPRSTGFPHPPHAPSRTDALLRKAMPGVWFAAPTARSAGGSRAQCCANGVCELCPIDAKFTVLNGIARFDRPGVSLVTGAEVRTVTRSAGTVTGVELVADGRSHEVAAPLVALGANAIGNTAILLRSGFTSPALGRYLHEQTSNVIYLDIDTPNYFGGTSITGHCYGFYDGPHRADTAAVLVENYNMPAAWRPQRGRWTERMYLKLIAEDLPQAENRVELVDDRPHITWGGHSAYGRRGVEQAIARIAEVIPFRIEGLHDRGETDTEAHIQGTHRMGTDPATSVVDGQLRVHEATGLLALGAGAFPTCSPANPTLTLSALALRAARRL